MKILIGTNNKNKLKQFRRIFLRLDSDIQLVSLKDVGITDDVEENEDNLLENAKKKAVFYGEKSGIMTLADDTGLFVDALNGEPGVHAKRWHDGTEVDRCHKLLEKLKDIPEEKRTCRYTGVLVVYNPETKVFWTYENNIEAVISDEFKGELGFGYDPIFKLEDCKHYAELTDEERDAISHRGLGVKELVKYLGETYKEEVKTLIRFVGKNIK
jgi:XTP/dITP diphosphohydrolase